MILFLKLNYLLVIFNFENVFRFIFDTVYDVSIPDDTLPKAGIYDGNTSIYCPVSYVNGKVLVGSKRYMAVYQNKYFYMSSAHNFNTFVNNPHKYLSLTNDPELYPKLKLSLLTPFGLDSAALTSDLLNAFNLTLVDWHKLLRDEVLPNGLPMLGEMFEEPTLRKIEKEYFIFENRGGDGGGGYDDGLRKYVDELRKYVDGKNAFLNDKDWLTLNSCFYQADEGICYKNYPRYKVELECLKLNGASPDVIVEVVANDREKGQKRAKRTVIENWLRYQYALVDLIVARDDETRRNAIASRRMLFISKLEDVLRRKEMNEIRARLQQMIEMIVVETIDGVKKLGNLCPPNSSQSVEVEHSTHYLR